MQKTTVLTVDSVSIARLEGDLGEPTTSEIVPYGTKVEPVVRSKTTYNAFRESKRRLIRGENLYPVRRLPVVTGDGILEEPKTYEEVLERGVKPERYTTCLETGLGSSGKPCPFVSCKRHLALETRGTSLVICAPHTIPGHDDDDPVVDIDFDSMEETCSNRLFEEPHTLETIGANLGLTRERVRQIESNGMKALHKYLGDKELTLLQSRIRESSAPNVSQLIGSIWKRKAEGAHPRQGDHSFLVQAVREEKIIDLVCVSGTARSISLSIENLRHKYEILYDGDTPIAAYAIQYWLAGS